MDSLGLSEKMETMSINPVHQPTRLTEIVCRQHDQVIEQQLLKEDYERHLCQLHYVLSKQTEERNDTSFSRSCLFCRKHFVGNRSLLFEHLAVEHNFYLGSLDNIVFANELLDAISQTLECFQCIYCEKIFKGWNVLKEHMRKKFHKRLNPKNKKYDIFFVESYKKKLHENIFEVNEDEDSSEGESDDEEDYMECQDEECVRAQECVCLLCPETLPDFEKTLLHMKDLHNFDFMGLKRLHRLDFYKQMKLCNYYRTQIPLNTCPLCRDTFPDHSVLLNHMISSGHVTQLPDMSHWDHRAYYSVAREKDNFLCSLDDEYEDTTSMGEPVVVPEDVISTWDPFLIYYLRDELETV